jgi:hypothetical protein
MTTYGDVAAMVISLPPAGDPGTGRQQHHIEGMPFGTRGGFIVEHNFPADGEYELTIGDMALAREVPRMEFENTVIALLDGTEFYRTTIGGDADHKAIDQRLDPAVEEINGRLRKIHFRATAGQHKLAITFVHRSFAESDERTRTIALEGGQERIQAVHAVQIRGPLAVTGMSESASRGKIFICKPSAPRDETACANKIVENLARRAFRRPVTVEDLNPLMAFYKQGRASAGFDGGVRDALSAILASPHFLYRAESGNTAGGTRTLSDLELASRLSFFLWSSIPDDELIELASQGKLRDPAVLEKQVVRMLADPKSESMTVNFTGQWLGVRSLKTSEPVVNIFPDFDDNLRAAYQREIELFFDSIVREDRSVIDLLTANYTYVNERLAKQYGIPNIYGSQFRRVPLPAELDVRRGLLGKGGLATLTSYANRTSPAVRGKWFLQTFLGVQPPDPPPNVPVLKEKPADTTGNLKSPTARQLMAAHTSNPTCATCHKIFEPIGLAMENFDAVGMWRTMDGDNAIDTKGVLADGTKVDGIASLRNSLVGRSDQFVRVVTEKLLTYGLGRGLEYEDMPMVRTIVRDSAGSNYKFSSIVLGIVKSAPFQMNTKSQGSQQKVAAK